MKDQNTGWKAIPITKLREILSKLPDDIYISHGEITHNLVLWKGVWPNEEYIGQIELVNDTLELTEDAAKELGL